MKWKELQNETFSNNEEEDAMTFLNDEEEIKLAYELEKEILL